MPTHPRVFGSCGAHPFDRLRAGSPGPLPEGPPLWTPRAGFEIATKYPLDVALRSHTETAWAVYIETDKDN